ncbi:lactoylglutathione lyase-like lyase [Xanthomonas vesicatoria ATCC 35937]|uniref:Lactoylglutathione lyase-like lyase n=2 Tax=Xanthomonas vesicatoria TaxID=56460 RepID=F0BE92_9XANT|nr:lactoylglutathione lyase-like lyase [Xanthomonas vesicatoria ATCC 35937]
MLSAVVAYAAHPHDQQDDGMLNHVMVGSNDIARARAFYDAVLGDVFGAPAPVVHQAGTGHIRLFYRHAGSTFSVSEPINDESASPGNGATVGVKCDSPEQVQRFHDIAVAAGGVSIENPPGLRESSMGQTWLAYVRDPDGNKLCAIYRPA